MSLESKYSKLKQKYKNLKNKYSDLQQAYNHLLESSQTDKQLIQSLRSDLENLEFQSSPGPSVISPILHSPEYSQSSAEKVIRTPNITSVPFIKKSEEMNEVSYNSNFYFSGSSAFSKCDQLNLLSPNPKKKIFSPKNLRSPSASSGKTPQANPDQSLHIELGISLNYQAFFVVGVGSTQEGDVDDRASILHSYFVQNDFISTAMLNIIPDLCFPLGVATRRLKLSGSQSDLNGVLYGQVPNKRNENCYVFTLRANEGNQEYHQDLPNSDQEILYFLCLKFDDLIVDSEGSEWVVPKAYVIASYIPIFTLHYDFLNSMLLIKRLNRTNIIGAGSVNMFDLIKEECCSQEIAQLESFIKSDSIHPGHEIKFGIDMVENLNYFCPNDLSTVDIEWLCIPLFTKLKFHDFFWLLMALLQEKSVVFVSTNLALLSSCVLAIIALIRPFKWPNLMVPIVPNSLKEVLDAPVPLVAGIPYALNLQERQVFSNIIWVLLEEPNISRRVQGPNTLVNEVAEPEVPQLRSNLNELFKVFDCENFKYVGNGEEKVNCVKIAKLLKSYFTKILDAFKGVTINEHNLTATLVSKFPIYDHKFIRAFSQTLVFNNKVSAG